MHKKYLEDVGSYFDISFLKFHNQNLKNADSYSQTSFLKFQT